MDKKTYVVAPGVPWVNGAPTPRDGKVQLTDAEAQYDLGLARIHLPLPAPKSGKA